MSVQKQIDFAEALKAQGWSIEMAVPVLYAHRQIYPRPRVKLRADLIDVVARRNGLTIAYEISPQTPRKAQAKLEAFECDEAWIVNGTDPDTWVRVPYSPPRQPIFSR